MCSLIFPIIFGIIIGCFSTCVSYRRFSAVRLHDPPDLSDEFQTLEGFYYYMETKFQREFKKWSNEDKKRACLRVLNDSASFIVVEDKAVDLVPELGLQKFDKDIIFSRIHKKFQLSTEETKLQRFDVDAQEFTLANAPVYRCVSIEEEEGTEVEFAITSGFHPSFLYLISRRSKEFNFAVIAISLALPAIDTRALTKRKLELSYFDNSEEEKFEDIPSSEEEEEEEKEEKEEDGDSFENLWYSIDLCKINDFKRLGLCATAYTAWAQFKNIVYREIDYILQPGLECLKDAKIISISRPGESRIADLLPCRIRNDDSPQIFVTVDNAIRNSIYIVEAVHKRDVSNYSSEQPDDDELLGYSLALHLNNVPSMKTHDDEE